MQYNQYQPTRFWNCSICTGNKTLILNNCHALLFWNCSICTGNKTNDVLYVQDYFFGTVLSVLVTKLDDFCIDEIDGFVTVLMY